LQATHFISLSLSYRSLVHHALDAAAGGGNLAVLTSGSQEELHVKQKHRLVGEQQEHYGKVPLPLQVRVQLF
jgi:hypothetical protein